MFAEDRGIELRTLALASWWQLRASCLAMPACAVSSPRCRQVLAALLAAQLLAIIALAVCPALHHWVHADADDGVHTCAVTLFLSGSCDAPAPETTALQAPRCAKPVAAPEMPEAPWVAPVFALNRLFEHGPSSAG